REFSSYTGRRVRKLVAFSFIESQTHNKAVRTDGTRRTSWLRKPFGYQLPRLRTTHMNLPLQRCPLRQSLFICRAVLGLRHQNKWRPFLALIIRGKFGQIVEECRQLVEILLGNGIEFVVMAIRATRCQSQKSRAVGFRSLAL